MRSPECDSLMIVIIIIIIQFLQMSYRLHTNGRAHSAIYWEPWIYAPLPPPSAMASWTSLPWSIHSSTGLAYGQSPVVKLSTIQTHPGRRRRLTHAAGASAFIRGLVARPARDVARYKYVGWTTGRASIGGLEAETPQGFRGPWSGSGSLKRKAFWSLYIHGSRQTSPVLDRPPTPAP